MSVFKPKKNPSTLSLCCSGG